MAILQYVQYTGQLEGVAVTYSHSFEPAMLDFCFSILKQVFFIVHKAEWIKSVTISWKVCVLEKQNK